MKTYELYIGSNNDTGELELEKIENILDQYADSYSVIPIIGRWLGQREESVQVLISVEDIGTLIEELKKELEQDAIGWRTTPALHFS